MGTHIKKILATNPVVHECKVGDSWSSGVCRRRWLRVLLDAAGGEHGC